MKRIVSYLCVALLFLFIQGCASRSAAPAPDVNTKNVSNEKSNEESNNPKLSKLVGKNYVKGIVKALKHDTSKQTWNYEIEGIETTNGKLPYVNFNHKSVLANEGDLVYASFDGMRLSEMFVVKEGFYKGGKRASAPVSPVRKKSTNTAESSAGKRDKAHQVIGVPQEETVRF